MSPDPKFPVRSRRAWLLIAAWAFAVWTVAAPAQSADPSAPNDKIEAFFGTVTRGDVAKAFDTLLDGSTISTNKPEAASSLKQQLATGLRVYGKPLGFDLVDKKVFGTSLIRLVYLFKLEKHPLTFEFFFYQSGRTSLPIDVRFNDKLDIYRYDRVPAATDTPPQP